MPQGGYDDWGDAILVARSADGDERAFGALLRRHSSYLRAYAIRLTGSRADADDVVQEAFIVAWGRLDSLDNPERFRPWMRRIVSTKGIDLLRSRRPDGGEVDENVPSPGANEPERHALASGGLSALSGALEQLPTSQRECWVLREIDGLAYEEIADRLGVSAAVVRGRLARARETLIRELEDWR